MSKSAGVSAPVAAPLGDERVASIDILRGVAILGILVVNVGAYAFPFMYRSTGTHLVSHADWVTSSWVQVLAEGKFFPLFSLLFGVGLFVQMERAAARGAGFVPLFLRRLAFLAVFGLVHGLAIWAGDILLLYALIGVALLLFRNVRPLWLVLIGAALLLVPAFAMLAFAGLFKVIESTPEGDKIKAEWQGELAAELQQAQLAIDHYAHGTLGEIFGQRFSDWLYLQSSALGSGPVILAMFLLGLAFAKLQLFGDSAPARRTRRWILWIGLVVGAPLNLTYAYVTHRSFAEPTLSWMMLSGALIFGGAPLLTLGYVAAITSLSYSRLGPVLAATFGAVGRMSLSNYLLQSVVAAIVFLSFGFGLFGQVPYATAVLASVGLYVLQILASRWWIGRYRFGPAEWLWRSLSYRSWQPLRRAGAAAASIEIPAA